VAASDDPSGARAVKVLIVTASVGAGHNAAARAVAAGLNAAAPEVAVETADVMDLSPWWFRAYYAGGFALAMTRFPWMYGLGYWFSDHPQRPGRSVTERIRLWQERTTVRRFRRLLIEQRPDVIVHTHFLAPPVVAEMVRREELATRQVVVLTDVDVHRFWYGEDVERWFVPSPVSVEAFERWGIEPGRVTVSGIPIHPKWTAPLDRAKILADWNLPADRKIVLLSGGAEFTCGPVARIARGIVADRPDACVVVLAGRSKKLLGKLGALPEAAQGRIVPVSFTDRVHELVEASSLMVTKAGGITTSECLAKAKPMVLTNPVPGQEGHNAAHYQRHGAAVIARGAKGIVSRVNQLLSDPAALAEMSDSARRLYRPATETVVSSVLGMLGGSDGGS
jgi:processive 1,2-diacylglycerol beta-glucosyltransferase